jgi:VanZ family protein
VRRSILTLWGPFLGALAVTFWLSSRSDVPGARYVWDKLLHTIGFAGLGVLALRAFHGGFERPRLSLTLYAGLTVILWGISDEFHQSFVPGRDATPWDVVADAVGFAVGVGVFAILTSRATRATRAVQPR